MKEEFITLNAQYDLTSFTQYIKKAKQQNIEELIVLESSVLFYECASLYNEVRTTYRLQEKWYHQQNHCSIKQYHAFISQIRKLELPIKIRFGLNVTYFTQHENVIKKLKQQFNYDLFVGSIDFLDNIAFDFPQSDQMMWNKYHTHFIYRRYYEMVNAFITSNLFDGIMNFDMIHGYGVELGYSLTRTYKKICKKLLERHMFIVWNMSYSSKDKMRIGNLCQEFIDLCGEMHLEIKKYIVHDRDDF